MKSPSQIVEETRVAYIHHLQEKGHDVTPGDYVAVVFLASTIVNDMFDRPVGINRMPGRVQTMINWANDYKPEAVEGIHQLFDNPKQARAIARVVFAGVKPAGSYDSKELLEGLQSGDVFINWNRDNQR